MLKALLLTAVLFAALPARADSGVVLPAIADVTGVAASDVLNVRAEPNADSAVLSELAPTATGIEIVGFDPSGAWARVSAGEASGWVSGRFLRLRTDTWQPGALPDTLVCVGTEPFWSLRRTAQGVEFSTPENRRALDLRVVLDRGIAQEPMRALIAGDKDGRLTAVIRPEACSDGMSDRAFGLSGTLIIDGSAAASRMLTGCCSIGR